MMTRRMLVRRLGVILAITGGIGPADAEWSIDVYGGASWAETTNVGVKGNDDTGASVNVTIFDVDTDLGGSFWDGPDPPANPPRPRLFARAAPSLAAAGVGPQGRVQPYVIAGPAWALTLEGDELDVVLGGKLAGGISFVLAGPLAVFGENRYTVFPDFKLTDQRLTYKADVFNHSLIGGIALRF